MCIEPRDGKTHVIRNANRIITQNTAPNSTCSRRTYSVRKQPLHKSFHISKSGQETEVVVRMRISLLWTFEI